MEFSRIRKVFVDIMSNAIAGSIHWILDGARVSMEISVLIPVYNEEGNVKPLHRKVSKELRKITGSYEILFIDDGSTDRTLKRIQKLMDEDPKVRVITFHRNFGKANALSVGFKHVKGKIVFTMDGDLQDDPKEFKRFIKELDKGYDIVSGWKFHRKDPIGKTLPSKVFNFLIRKMTGVNVHDSNCGFKAYRKEVVDMVDVYGEFHRYIPIIANWRGFRVGEIKVTHHKRASGRSKYGIERLFKGFIDLLTISYLTKYGRSPMYLFGSFSFLTFVLSIISAGWTLIDAIFSITDVEWVFAIGSLMLFLSSLTFLSIGLLSEMLLLNVGHEKMTKTFYREIK